VKEQYIAAKERWAQKLAGKAKPGARSTNRLPPGQRQVHNFPVLELGIQPDIPLDLNLGETSPTLFLRQFRTAWKSSLPDENNLLRLQRDHAPRPGRA